MMQNKLLKQRNHSQGFVHILFLVLFLLGVSTFGVINTQSEVIKRQSESQRITPAALQAAKEGLIDYAHPEPGNLVGYGDEVGLLYPKVNHFSLDNFISFRGARALSITLTRKSDDRFIVSRPGQLPCPDLADGTSSAFPHSSDPLSSYAASLSAFVKPGINDYNDGILDGVSDPGQGLCSDTNYVNYGRPSAYGSDYGRYPFAQVNDFYDFVRGAGIGDLKDQFGQRLWYRASQNVLNVSKPINPYSIARTNTGWLSVVITTHVAPNEPRTNFHESVTVTNIAAVVIAPGSQTPSQENRIPEDQLLAPGVLGVINNLGVLAGANLYLEGANVTTSLPYVSNVGNIANSDDQISFVHKDELLVAFDTNNNIKYLDGIADSLYDYYSLYNHLPEPATFDGKNADYITRRIGRPGIIARRSFDTGTAELSNTSAAYNELTGDDNNGRDSINIELQGGKIRYAGAPITKTATDVTYRNSLFNPVRVTGVLDATKISEVYLDASVPESLLALTDEQTYSSDIELPPFGSNFHPNFNSFLSSVTIDSEKIVFATVEPNALFRTAKPLRVTQDINVLPIATFDPTAGITNLTLAAADFDDASTNPLFIGEEGANVVFSDVRLGFLGDLSRLGYSTYLPTGTHVSSSETVTIYGPSASLGTLSMIRRDVAFGILTGENNPDFTYGIGNATNYESRSVPNLSPVIAGSQGLLSTPLLPGQLPNSYQEPVSVNPEGYSFKRQNAIAGTRNQTRAIGEIRKIDRVAGEYLVITDIHGAIGQYPAKVTLAQPYSDFVQATANNNALFNQLPRYTESAANRDDIQLNQVIPNPLVVNGIAIQPSTLTFQDWIVLPANTKFIYPYGSRVPLGNNFLHASQEHIFKDNNYIDNVADIVPFDELGTAILPAGTVLRGISTAVDQILPDGGGPYVPLSNPYDEVTLTYGGVLRYSYLTHYHDGDQSLLPITPEQAAFRVEAMGMGLLGITVAAASFETTVTVVGPGAVTLAEFDDVINSDGFHVYPYHDSYAVMSRRLDPLPIFSANNYHADQLRNVTYATVTSHVNNLVARADVFAYNIGSSQLPAYIETVLTPAPNRQSFTSSTSSGYAPVNEFGFGIETSPFYDQNVDFSFANTVQTQGASSDLTLNFNRGVHMQANPSRIAFDPITTLRNTNANLLMQQLDDPVLATPFTAPFIPGVGPNIETGLTLTVISPTLTVVSTIQIANPQASELALKFSNEVTLSELVATANTLTPYSDLLALGSRVDSSKRVIFNLKTDSHVSDVGAPFTHTFLPAGSKVEIGYLNNQYCPTIGTDPCENHILPGGRVFDGVGFYPIGGRQSAVRMNHPLISLPNLNGLTLALATGTTAATVTLQGSTGTLQSSYLITLGVASTIRFTLNQTKLYLPAGADVGPGTIEPDAVGVDKYVFGDNAVIIAPVTLVNPAITVSFENVMFEPPSNVSMFIELEDRVVVTDPTTLLPENIGDFSDIANLEYLFLANGGGVVTNPDVLSYAVRQDYIAESQLLRLRLAPDNFATPGTDDFNLYPLFTLLNPMFELSWNGVDGQWDHTKFDPQDLVFAQNNPLFYAIADDCQKDALFSDVSCASEAGQGLEVNVGSGDIIRLPEDSVVPAGLVIYADRDARRTPGELIVHDGTGLGTTVTLLGVRVNEDGTLDGLVFDSSDADLATVVPPALINSLGIPLGDEMVIEPQIGGLHFRLDSVIENTFTLFANSLPANSKGYSEPVTLINGGYTLDKITESAYKVNLPSGSTLGLNFGSTIYTSDNIANTSLHLSPGSYYQVGAVTTFLDGFDLVNGGIQMEVTLQDDAIIKNQRLSLPTRLTAKTILTVGTVGTGGTFIAPEHVDFSDREELFAGTAIDISSAPQGYIWQGYIAGTNVTAYAVNTLTTSATLLVRNYNHSSPTLTINGNTRPFGDYNMPGHYGLLNSSLTINSTVTLDYSATSTTPITMEIGCHICGIYTVDIQHTVGGSSVLQNAPTITIAKQVRGYLSYTEGGTLRNSIQDIAVYKELIITLSIAIPAGHATLPEVRHQTNQLTITITGENSHYNFTDFDSAIEVLQAGALPFYSTVDTRPVANNLAIFSSVPTHFRTTATIIAADTTLTIGQLPAQTGIAIDAFADRTSAPIIFTAGVSSVAIQGPIALFQKSALTPLTYLAGLNAAYQDPLTDSTLTSLTLVEQIRDSGQLFFEESTELVIDGEEAVIALQVPTPQFIFGGTTVYAGSLILPNKGENGEIYRAKRFSSTIPFTLTLSAGGVGNIVKGGGAGRPMIYTRPNILELGNQSPVTANSRSNLNQVSRPTLSYSLDTSTVSVAILGQNLLSFDDGALGNYVSLALIGPTTQTIFDMSLVDSHIYTGTRDNPDTDLMPLADETSLLVPAVHEINFGTGSEIIINPHPSIHPSGLVNNGDIAPFQLPAGSILNALQHVKGNRQLTPISGTDISGANIYRTTATPMPRATIVANISIFNQSLANITQFNRQYEFFGTKFTLSSERNATIEFPNVTTRGLHKSINDSAIYQNIWIRISDPITLNNFGVQTILPSDTVINPFLGTYLAPKAPESQGGEPRLATIRLNSLNTVIINNNIVVSKPALKLPRGITLEINNRAARFTNVKAVLAYSPAPLEKTYCSSTGDGVDHPINQFTELLTTHVIPDLQIATGVSGYNPEPEIRNVGEADICLLLDLPENTDFDTQFDFVSDTRYDVATGQPVTNDQMRLVGGKLVL